MFFTFSLFHTFPLVFLFKTFFFTFSLFHTFPLLDQIGLDPRVPSCSSGSLVFHCVPLCSLVLEYRAASLLEFSSIFCTREKSRPDGNFIIMCLLFKNMILSQNLNSKCTIIRTRMCLKIYLHALMSKMLSNKNNICYGEQSQWFFLC